MTILNQRYELHEKLGEGGMAEVYRATQLTLDREVAVKFIKPTLADEQFRQRFEREAKAVAALNHPNILHIHDFDQADDGRFFLVMERLIGSDLATRLREQKGQPFSLIDALTITRSVADALHYAHQHDIVHRDVKPANIFITENNRVIVMDFGIAKLLSDAGLTQTGATVGTPHYFAPEQGYGQTIDHRADIYALGVVFYELLTGHTPYQGDTTLSVIAQHANAPIPDPRDERPALPAVVTEVIMQAMAKQPDDRYPEMAALIDDLDALLSDAPTDERTIRLKQTPTPPTVTPAPMPTADSEGPTRVETGPPSASRFTRRRWPRPLGAALVIAALLAVVAFLVLQGGDDAGDTTSDATVETPSSITPAAEGEYLVIVADFAGDEEAGLDITRRVVNTLEAGDLAALLSESFRVETTTQIIKSAEEAEALGQVTNALYVVWGVLDAAGLEVVIQAPNYPEDTLQRMAFTVPAGENFASSVITDMPVALGLFSQFMAMQQIIVDEQFIGILSLGLNVFDDEDIIGLGERVVPASAMEDAIIDAFEGLIVEDFHEADAALTQAINLAPNDPALFFNRWNINAFFLVQFERARQDALALQELLPDNAIGAFALNMTALYEEDYEGVLHITDDLAALSETGNDYFDVMIFYRGLANLALGNFEDVEAELTASADEDSAFGEIFPSTPALLAFTYEVAGNEPLAEANRQIIRGSRILEDSANLIMLTQTAPSTFTMFSGYAVEVLLTPALASNVYDRALAESPDDYLLNWRRAITAEAAVNYQQAHDRYLIAIENAPVPFPIAAYHLALLANEHGDELTSAPAPCALLAEAQAQALTSPDFYAVLLENITATQEALSCRAGATSQAPIDTAPVATSITPAAEGEYLVIVTDFAGDDANGVDAAERIANVLRTGDLASVLGQNFRLVKSEAVITSQAEAESLAAQTDAHLIIWGQQNALGLEIITQAHGYPERTLSELRFLVPSGDDFINILLDEVPEIVAMNARFLTFQRLLRQEAFVPYITLMTYHTLALEELAVVPSTPLDQHVLDIYETSRDSDLPAYDQALTEVINLLPEDPALYYWRSTANVLGPQPPNRALSDIETMETLLSPDNMLVAFMAGSYRFFTDDYDMLINIKDEYQTSNIAVSYILDYYRAVALAMTGEFETGLEQIGAIDQTLINETFGFPVLESFRGLMYEIQGDQTSAEIDRQALRSSRFLEQSATSFIDPSQVQTPPLGLVLYGGYVSEVNGDTVLATLAYQATLAEHPDAFLVLWRRAIVAEAVGDYQTAADHYQLAIDHAPTAFPVANYQLAQLVATHANDLQEPPDICDLLLSALMDAESNADFYAILLQDIETAIDEAGCNQP